MKRAKKMLALLSVLALLVAGYYAAGNMQETQSVTQTEGTFELGTWTQESLAGLAWANDNGAFDFSLQDGTWVASEDAAFPVNQSALQNLADKIIDLTAEREITDVTNPGDYGLDSPVFSVTLTDTDGNKTVYAMGDETPFGDGYYLSVSGRNAIYTIETSLSDMFNKTLTKLCRLEEIPELDTVTRMDISGAVNAAYDEGTGLWSDSVSGETLDTDAVEDLIDMAKGIEWTQVVTASATEEDLAGYGVDDAQGTLLHLEGGEDAALEILIGLTDEDGNTYARLPGSAMVYTVESAVAEELLSAGMDTLWNRAPVRLMYDSVKEAAFTWESGSLAIAGGAQTGMQEEGGEEAAALSAEESLWALVTSLTGSERVESAAQGERILTIDYADAGDRKYVVSIYAYDVDSYLLPISETHAMLIDAGEVDTIIRMLKAM